jgi:CheY-like chemotaxis protein
MEAQDTREGPPIVLAIDADEAMREMYGRLFGPASLWFADPADAHDALAMARDFPPDAIVLDGCAPTAETLIDQLRDAQTDSGLADVPLIVVAKAVRQYGDPRELRVNAYLRKPVDVETLRREISRLVRPVSAAPSRASEFNGRIADMPPPHNSQSSRASQDRHPLKFPPQREELQSRFCPTCNHPLEWSERRTLNGVTFDYYQWCVHRCGLYCFDHCRGSLVLIA